MKVWLFIVAAAFSVAASAASVAPNRGGVNDGPPAIDTASDGTKNGTFSLNYNKSSCLRLSYGKPRHIPDEDSPPGADNTLWIENTCSIPIEFAFCSIGEVQDGFNCTPDSKSVLAPQVVYQTGEWGLEARGATSLGTARSNRVVWYACDWSQKKAPLPLLTSFNPPMGLCWDTQSDSAGSPDAFRNRQGSASRNRQGNTQSAAPESSRNADGTPRTPQGRVLGERSAGGSVNGTPEPQNNVPTSNGQFACARELRDWCTAGLELDRQLGNNGGQFRSIDYCENGIDPPYRNFAYSNPKLYETYTSQKWGYAEEYIQHFERYPPDVNPQYQAAMLQREKNNVAFTRCIISAYRDGKMPAQAKAQPRANPQVIQSYQKRAVLARSGNTLQPVTLKMLNANSPSTSPLVSGKSIAEKFARLFVGTWSADCSGQYFAAYWRQQNDIVGETREPAGFREPFSFQIALDSVKFLGVVGGKEQFSYRIVSTPSHDASRKAVFETVIEATENSRRILENKNIDTGAVLIRLGVIESAGVATKPINKCE